METTIQARPASVMKLTPSDQQDASTALLTIQAMLSDMNKESAEYRGLQFMIKVLTAIGNIPVKETANGTSTD